METVKVLLCCGAGMSSGFLASNARKAIKKKKLNMTVEARSYSEASELMPTIDVLLIGPHYAKDAAKFQEKGAPLGVAVEVIPQDIYATLDGARLVDLALKLKESK